MSKVINILTKMANDARLTEQSSLVELLNNSNLSEAQKQAFISANSNALVKSTYNFPYIKCFPIILPDEQNRAQDDSIITKQPLTVNARAI